MVVRLHHLGRSWLCVVLDRVVLNRVVLNQTNCVQLNQINQIVMCPGGSLLDRTPISLRSRSTNRTSPILPGLTVITVCPSTSPSCLSEDSILGLTHCVLVKVIPA